MKAYITVTGLIFGVLTLAHIARIFAEGARIAAEPWFILVTAMAAALCLWACVLMRRLTRR